MSHETGKRPDARTTRTYRALSAAMVDLMHTLDFDAITVQHLLDRAGVGRATFYTHFRNKDDFLLSDLERMLSDLESRFEVAAAGSMRLAPVRELLEHMGNAREFAKALGRSGRLETVFDIVCGHFARIIERRLRVLRAEATDLPLSAAARVLAAMALELMKWWLGRETSFSAHDMDVRFHELAWRGVGPRRFPERQDQA